MATNRTRTPTEADRGPNKRPPIILTCDIISCLFVFRGQAANDIVVYEEVL